MIEITNEEIKKMLPLMEQAANEFNPSLGLTFRTAKQMFPDPHSGDFEWIVFRAMQLFAEHERKEAQGTEFRFEWFEKGYQAGANPSHYGRHSTEAYKRLFKNTEPVKKYPIGGYAPGDYMCHCATCGHEFTGDKRSFQCEPCATGPSAILPIVNDTRDAAPLSGVRVTMHDLIERIQEEEKPVTAEDLRAAARLYHQPWDDDVARRVIHGIMLQFDIKRKKP